MKRLMILLILPVCAALMLSSCSGNKHADSTSSSGSDSYYIVPAGISDPAPGSVDASPYNALSDVADDSTNPIPVVPSSTADSDPGIVSLRFLPQANIGDIAGFVELKGICSNAAFKTAEQTAAFNYNFISKIPQNVHYRLEGYLYPDTYQFYKDTDAKTVINTMLSKFNSQISQYLSAVKSSKFTLHQILTLASMLQAEADSQPADMRKVEAVFENRLRDWKSEYKDYLNCDPTVTYAKLSGVAAYNTYKNIGLPPGPICNPSTTAISAALNPDPAYGDYYYFVSDKNKVFYYSKTSDEQTATINRLKAQGLM